MDELIRKQDALNAFCLDNRMFLPRNSGRTGTYVKMVMDGTYARLKLEVADVCPEWAKETLGVTD